jgi:hypothetical protein
MKISKSKDLIVALIFVAVIGCLIGGCALVSKVTGVPEQQLKDDAVTAAEGATAAVETLDKAAALVLPIACTTGQLDANTCALYQKANAAAAVALPKVDAALVAYKADPSTANGSVLDAAKTAVYEAWSTYNEVNGAKPFVDQGGNPIGASAASPTPSAAPAASPVPTSAGGSTK